MSDTATRTYKAVIVDGVRYPADLSAINGQQVVWMRGIKVSPADMIARLSIGAGELPEIVALMGVSIEQAGGELDLPALLGAVTLSSDVHLELDEPVTS